MTQPTTLPFGTALALAQRTLTAPLTAVLAAEGVEMTQWFTLNALGLRTAVDRDDLASLLATNGLDPAASHRLIDAMRDAGLVHLRDGVASLSAAGTARYTGLRDRIKGHTSRIFERFDAARVENARALLQEIAALDPDELTHLTNR